MKILITGGCGFIGSNAAEYFLKKGHEVTLLDNLSRKGTELNLNWLQKNYPNVEFVKADIVKDQELLNEAVEGKDVLLHLAAQVAVTTSVTNPREDFEINALGTFNVLEAVRNSESKPFILYTSTNKVYGEMLHEETTEINGKYMYANLNGVDEQVPLDFHSPYGCSKGAADQYVIDYSRIYGLKTVVCRQSCIYGYRQFGIEDQGWVAWFTIATAFNRPLTIFGDGKQVRDVLFSEDLVELYELMIENQDIVSGKAYNVGGGPDNNMSLLELVKYLEGAYEREIPLSFGDWRPGDQKVFICDIAKLELALGWKPKVSPEEGVKKLAKWVQDNKDEIGVFYKS